MRKTLMLMAGRSRVTETDACQLGLGGQARHGLARVVGRRQDQRVDRGEGFEDGGVFLAALRGGAETGDALAAFRREDVQRRAERCQRAAHVRDEPDLHAGIMSRRGRAERSGGRAVVFVVTRRRGGRQTGAVDSAPAAEVEVDDGFRR